MNNPKLDNKPTILIFHPWFLPAYKAGGPIQSLANLCRSLKDEYHFLVVCGAYEYKEKQVLASINQDCWNDFENGTAKVFYLSSKNANAAFLKKLVAELKVDCYFINGLYDPLYTVIPLTIKGAVPKVLSVRGMLHPGALSQKKIKKAVYLRFLKLAGLVKNVKFHATDQTEANFIFKYFGKDTPVGIAGNFPASVIGEQQQPEINGTMKLVSVALISPMKNHALVLESLKNITHNVQYDIYGPVKDIQYWNHCEMLIKDLPSNIQVNYKGSLEPIRVQSVMRQYHFFIQPSKSENFGHSIYEALATGLPVITSHHTPWNNLENLKAGWNVEIQDCKSLVVAVNKAKQLLLSGYAEWSDCAWQYAQSQVDIFKIKDQYRSLFQNSSN